MVSATPLTDNDKCRFMKMQATYSRNGDPVSIFKPRLESHPTMRAPVLVSMPDPPAARFAMTADGDINPSVVLLERRKLNPKGVINTFVSAVPFIETMVSGDVNEAPGTDAWNPLYSAMFSRESLQELERAAPSRQAMILTALEKGQNSPLMMPVATAHDVCWRFFQMV